MPACMCESMCMCIYIQTYVHTFVSVCECPYSGSICTVFLPWMPAVHSVWVNVWLLVRLKAENRMTKYLIRFVQCLQKWPFDVESKLKDGKFKWKMSLSFTEAVVDLLYNGLVKDHPYTIDRLYTAPSTQAPQTMETTHTQTREVKKKETKAREKKRNTFP